MRFVPESRVDEVVAAARDKETALRAEVDHLYAELARERERAEDLFTQAADMQRRLGKLIAARDRARALLSPPAPKEKP